MFFIDRCSLRREELPLLPCNCKLCEWFVCNDTFNNCFWVLAEFLSFHPGYTLSSEEIAQMEKINIQDVEKICETAMEKLRRESRKIVKEDLDFDDT